MSDLDLSLSDDDLELDIEIDIDINQLLTASAKRSRDIARVETAWQATQSILYVQILTCQTCGAHHTIPNDRLLTEWVHRSGTKNWCSSEHVEPNLPVIQRHLDSKPIPVCHHCTGLTDTDH